MGGEASSLKDTKGKVRVTVVGANVKLAKRHSMLFKDPNVFVVVSTNNTYELSEEIEKMPKGTSVPSDELRKCLQVFQEYDKDGSGTMDRREFQELFGFLEPSIGPERIQELFSIADTSADDLVDYQELIAWLYDEDAPQNKNLALPALSAEKVFKTRAKKHTSKPQWNEIGIIDLDASETLVFSLYDSFTFHKDTLIHQFKSVDPRGDDREQKLHLKGEVDGTVVELEVVVRPEDTLRMNSSVCQYMPCIDGQPKVLKEHHFGDTVLIKDFVAHINKEHGMNLKLEDLYSVTYFGFVSGLGPDFHPLEELAETTVGKQPTNEFIGGGCLYVMHKAVVVQVEVDAAKYEVKLDASAKLLDLFCQLKEQHGVDAMDGFIYEYEHEFMNQVTTKLEPVGKGDSKLWEQLKDVRVYALIERQKSRKTIKLLSTAQCPMREIACLAPLNNGSDIFGKVSVSMAFTAVKTAIPNSSPVDALVGTEVGGAKECYIYKIDGDHVERMHPKATGADLSDAFAGGKLWAFIPHTSPLGRHVPMTSDAKDEIEEYTKCGDSQLEGYFFTKFVPDDRRHIALQLLNAFNDGRLHTPSVQIKRIHSGDEEDKLSDNECSIM